jgi:hypothetical protein
MVSRSSYNMLLASLLLLSAALGLVILRVDWVLWFYASPHAYGLLFFVLMDILLAALVFAKPRSASLLAGTWGTIQLLLMTGNIFFGAAFGVDCEGMEFRQEDLRDYLVGAVEDAPSDYGFYSISPYSYLLLLGIQGIIASTGLFLYIAYRRS